MSRESLFNNFWSSGPSDADVLKKIQEERDNLDKQVALARLKGISNPSTFADRKDTWSQIAARVEEIDQWLGQPIRAKGKEILKKVWVELPKDIDFEITVLDHKLVAYKNIDLLKKGDDSLIAKVAQNIQLIMVLSILYNITRK